MKAVIRVGGVLVVLQSRRWDSDNRVIEAVCEETAAAIELSPADGEPTAALAALVAAQLRGEVVYVEELPASSTIY